MPGAGTRRRAEQNVVVLNASFELLAVVNVPRAVTYLLLSKAVVVRNREGLPLRSAGGFEMPVPHIVRLTKYVRLPVSARTPAWTRLGLLARDGNTCAYCARHATTIDHVLPVSRGGRSTWKNTVAACTTCNFRKANRTPEEANMELRFRPATPTVHTALLVGLGQPDVAALHELGLAVA